MTPALALALKYICKRTFNYTTRDIARTTSRAAKHEARLVRGGGMDRAPAGPRAGRGLEAVAR